MIFVPRRVLPLLACVTFSPLRVPSMVGVALAAVVVLTVASWLLLH